MLLGDEHHAAPHKLRAPKSRSVRLLRTFAAAAIILLIGAGTAIVLEGLFNTNLFNVASRWSAQSPQKSLPKQGPPLAMNTPRKNAAAHPTSGRQAPSHQQRQRQHPSTAAVGGQHAKLALAGHPRSHAAASGFSWPTATLSPPAERVVHIRTSDLAATRRTLKQWAVAHHLILNTPPTATTQERISRDSNALAKTPRPTTQPSAYRFALEKPEPERFGMTLAPAQMHALVRTLKKSRQQTVTLQPASAPLFTYYNYARPSVIGGRVRSKSLAERFASVAARPTTQPARPPAGNKPFDWLSPLQSQLPLAHTVALPAAKVHLSIIIEPAPPILLPAASQPVSPTPRAANPTTGLKKSSPTSVHRTPPATAPSPASP